MLTKNKAVKEIYVKYGLKHIDAFEEDALEDIESALWLLTDDYLIFNEDLSESFGSWISGKLDECYSELIVNVVEAGKGKVVIERFVSKMSRSNSLGSDAVIDISFIHKNKTYSWSFVSGDYASLEYIVDIADWATSALGRGFFCAEINETLTAWYIVPDALDELKSIYG